MRSSSLRIHRKITFSLLSPAFRVFEVFEVFEGYVVFKEIEVCAAVRGSSRQFAAVHRTAIIV